MGVCVGVCEVGCVRGWGCWGCCVCVCVGVCEVGCVRGWGCWGGVSVGV